MNPRPRSRLAGLPAAAHGVDDATRLFLLGNEGVPIDASFFTIGHGLTLLVGFQMAGYFLARG